MPLHLCPPEAPHKKLRMPEWYVSSLMMDRALDAIMRRVKHLDRRHDIPYLAGYSLDGKTIYIDRHVPKSFKFRGRVIEIDRFLVLHEEVEKTLIDQLGLHYLHAHQIATRAEQAAVRAAGISWRAYDRFMQKYVKRDGQERLTKVPADLDTKPYRDEHDLDLLRRMMAAIERGHMGHMPSARGKASVSKAVLNVIENVHTHRREKALPGTKFKRGPTARRQDRRGDRRGGPYRPDWRRQDFRHDARACGAIAPAKPTARTIRSPCGVGEVAITGEQQLVECGVGQHVSVQRMRPPRLVGADHNGQARTQ